MIIVIRKSASMEPQLFSRGNILVFSKEYTGTQCFNGAAAFQPRKSILSFRASYQYAVCFNGAAAFQPRKSADIRDGRVGTVRASMEPQLFSRGNARTAQPDRSQTPSFNGAAAFQPRKFLRNTPRTYH